MQNDLAKITELIVIIHNENMVLIKHALGNDSEEIVKYYEEQFINVLKENFNE